MVGLLVALGGCAGTGEDDTAGQADDLAATARRSPSTLAQVLSTTITPRRFDELRSTTEPLLIGCLDPGVVALNQIAPSTLRDPSLDEVHAHLGAGISGPVKFDEKAWDPFDIDPYPGMYVIPRRSPDETFFLPLVVAASPNAVELFGGDDARRVLRIDRAITHVVRVIENDIDMYFGPDASAADHPWRIYGVTMKARCTRGDQPAPVPVPEL